MKKKILKSRMEFYRQRMHEHSRERHKALMELQGMRAQLAEAHALLREVHGGMWPSNPLTIKIGSHLSANADGSVPDVRP